MKAENQGEQKITWSEEDEKILANIICSVNACDALDGTISISLEKHEKKISWLKSLKDRVQSQNTWKPSDEHYELEEFAKIVRSNLTSISKAVRELFEAKYLQLTGNKMYGGYKD